MTGNLNPTAMKINKKEKKDPKDEFKYTEEEINDLINWFKGKELPKSLRLDSGTFIPDVAKTVELMSVIVINKQTRTFETTANQLFKIKALSERYINGEPLYDDQQQTNQTL